MSASTLRLFASGANRVAIHAALRGTAAAAVPFFLLRQTGHPVAAMFATIAILNVSIADSGGPYRQRLAVMLAIALVVPLVLILGMRCPVAWWAAPVAMFAVAMLGGMARLLGAAGTSVGLIAGVVFLVGLEVPGDWPHTLQSALTYLGGASWALLVTLVFWRLRPYRRVRYEIGEVFSQLAIATHWLEARCTLPYVDCQAELAAAHAGVQNALQQAEQTLGATLSETNSIPPFLSDLIVLVRAASRVQASLLGLGGALTGVDPGSFSKPRRADLVALIEQIENGCRNLAAGLLDKTSPYAENSRNTREPPWASIDLARDDNAPLQEAETFVNVIRRQLESSYRVLDRLAGQRHGIGLLPPLHGPSFPNAGWSALRANLTFRSLIFRHALRVATASALATAVYRIWHIPHGIWIPLTVLIVLQPQLGATLSKALQRTGGTVLGAILAGILVLMFHQTPGVDFAILTCFFLTLLFLRRHYWVAAVFLTPLIILLLSLLVHHPWSDIIERILNTLAGAGLALAAGYFLWPSWEYRRLPEEINAAVRANSAYLHAIFDAAARGIQPGWPLAGRRARAELDTSNARASLERMMAEPRRFQLDAAQLIDLVTHLERLTRHLSRLSIYLHQWPEARLSFGDLPQAFDLKLQTIAQAVAHDKILTTDDSLESAYMVTRRTWQTTPPGPPDWRIVDSLIGSIIADINSLGACLTKHLQTPSTAPGQE